MSANKEAAKAAKKLAKAQAKALKKQMGGESPSIAAVQDASRPTPAERSAEAAEKQLVIRRRQLWITLTGVLIALATLLYSMIQCRPGDAAP